MPDIVRPTQERIIELVEFYRQQGGDAGQSARAFTMLQNMWPAEWIIPADRRSLIQSIMVLFAREEIWKLGHRENTTEHDTDAPSERDTDDDSIRKLSHQILNVMEKANPDTDTLMAALGLVTTAILLQKMSDPIGAASVFARNIRIMLNTSIPSGPVQ